MLLKYWILVVSVWTNDYFVLDMYLISNSKCNMFICAHLVLLALKCTISGIPSLSNNSNTSNYLNTIYRSKNLE